MERNNKKILIVDDELDILKLTLLRLKRSGFDVTTAHDGEEGVHVARTERPDLILLDMVLPRMHGGEVCKCLKSDDNLRSIPIILFTASSNSMTADRAEKLGADDFIVKPFNPEELIAKIENALYQKAS